MSGCVRSDGWVGMAVVWKSLNGVTDWETEALGEEQALGAVGAFSGAPVRGVCARRLPVHKAGIEAEREGRFPGVKKISLMACLYDKGEMRAMKIIYNKRICISLCKSSDWIAPDLVPN